MFITWGIALFFVSLVVCVTCEWPCDPSSHGDYYLCHETDPGKYYACSGGHATLMNCPSDLHFDRASVKCLYPGKADCSHLADPGGPVCPAGHVGLLPHPDKCHWYIKCTAEGQVGRLGSDRPYDECTYPQMFSILTHQCEDFLQVACYDRQEVKHPCGYRLSGVPDVTHVSVPLPNLPFFCPFSNPTCTGRPNGLNPHPIVTYLYIKCYEERTVAMYQCALGLFWDQTQMKCV